MNYASFVWKNMVRNRRRTLLTILSSAVSLCYRARCARMEKKSPEALPRLCRALLDKARGFGAR